MNKTQLQELVDDKILTGGRRTTAQKVRDVLNAFINSFINNEDGATTAVKINSGMVVNLNNIYIKSNGASSEPGATFFKLEFDDYGNIVVPLPQYTSVNYPNGISDATALVNELNS